MLLPVILAALAAFVIGFLLHGPVGGKLWMRLADIHPTGNEKFVDMIPQMLWNLAANLATAAGLAIVIAHAGAAPLVAGALGRWNGIHYAIVAWAAFLVPATSMDVIWMGRKRSLWLYEAGCSLVAMVAMGAILGGK